MIYWVTWCSTWLFPFMLSIIFLIQSSSYWVKLITIWISTPINWYQDEVYKSYAKIIWLIGVMSWSRDLPITWSRHMTTHMIYSHDLDTWPLTWSTHMISIRDHSHDFGTWPTNYILTSSHHRYQHPCHHFIATSWSFIHATISSHHRSTCLRT